MSGATNNTEFRVYGLKALVYEILIFGLILGVSGLISAEVQIMPGNEFCGWSTNASCSENAECRAGGCSGQVCSEINESIVTTCEWLDCYNVTKYNVSCGCFNNTCRWNEKLMNAPEECMCSSCSDCEAKLNNNSCNVVKLTRDIINQPGTCINNPPGFNNKIFDCQGHFIDGDDSTGNNDFGIDLNSKSNDIIRSCEIMEFSGRWGSDWNHGKIIRLTNANNVTIINNTIHDGNNAQGGIGLAHSTNCKIIGNTVYNIISTDGHSHYSGIWLHGYNYMGGSSNNIITNNTVYDNDQGIWLTGESTSYAHQNTITDNTVINNLIGIYLYPNSDNNGLNSNEVCGNNNRDILDSGTDNSGDENICNTTNNWNDTGTAGCTYSCGEQSSPGECTCTSCSDCEAKLNNDSCTAVKLTQDIINQPGTCINNPARFNNKIFECQEHTIDGDGTSIDYGVYFDGKFGNTIRNCIITEFGDGIYIQNSNNNTIINNNANNNAGNSGSSNRHGNGIYLDHSSNNSIINNNANNNDGGTNSGWNFGGNGIQLYYSSNNNIINNTANNNTGYDTLRACAGSGIYIEYSSNNNISANKVSLNNIQPSHGGGIFIMRSSHDNRITNNNASSNHGNGISFYYSVYPTQTSNHNILANNIVNLNGGSGISMNGDNNLIINNTVNSNNNYGMGLSSSNNTLISNRVCGNNNYDIGNSSNGNSGDDDTCDIVNNWNDTGTTGCDYNCNEIPSIPETWRNCSRQYRKEINVSETSGINLNDYQVSLNLDTQTLILGGKMNPDCLDILFRDNRNEIPYWVESGCNTHETKIWLKLNITANATKIIYIYYGNPDASGNRRESTVFDFFDGFDYTDKVSNHGWTIVNYPSYESIGASLENGILHFRDDYTYSGSAVHYKKEINISSKIVEFDVKGVSCTAYGGVYFGTSDGYYNMLYTIYSDRIASSSGYYGSGDNPGYIYYFNTTSEFSSYGAVIENGISKLYINGNLVIEQPANPGIYNVRGIEFGLGNSGAKAEAYFDNIKARKYASTEPTFKPGNEEKNNCENAKLPDLTLTALTFSNENPNAGEEVTITATIENVGGSCEDSNNPDDGLVAYWSFDDVSGNIVPDEAGNNNGTIYGANVVGGVSGNALEFDGLDDYVNSGNLQMPEYITVCAWVKPHSDGVNIYDDPKTIISKYNHPTPRGWSLGWGTGKPIFLISRDGSEMPVCTSSDDFDVLLWYYICGTYDGMHSMIYVNGNVSGSCELNGTLYAANSYPVTIGQYHGYGYAGWGEFDGLIDDVKIYNRALTPNEIKANYNKIMNPSCVNLNLNKINVSLYVDGSYKDSKLVDLSIINLRKVNFSWIAKSGNHNLVVKVDANDEISESNESNNKISTAISVPLVCNMKEVFYDDFNWTIWSASRWDRCGSPLPSIHATSGNPSPSFRSNGDGWCHSGAHSKVEFNYSNGLAVEADSFWPGGTYGIHYHDWVLDIAPPGLSCSNAPGNPPCDGDCGVETKAIALIHILGYLNTITYQIIADNGSIESHTEPYTKMNEWHTNGIYIRPDRKVEFYEDGVLKWTSTQKIIQYNETVPVGIGGRSNMYNVLHDNVKVFECEGIKPEPTRLPDLTITNLTLSNENPKASEEVTITATVENVGGSCEDSNNSDDGLVAYWSFDDNKGNVLHDLSGNNNDGIIYGANLVDGILGKALYFDGDGDYVEVTPKSNVSAIGDFTISACIYLENWKNQTASSIDRQYIFDGHSHSKNVTYDFYRQGFFLIYDGNSYTEEIHDGINYNNVEVELDTGVNLKGKWIHHVFMRKGDADYTYIDGQLISVNYVSDRDMKRSDLLNMQHNWFIGTFSGNNPYYNSGVFNYGFYGKIDEMKIYNRALMESEIKADYNKIINKNGVMQLTSNQGNNGGPVFSPDGTKIVFSSDRSGNNEIWVMNSDGSNPVQLTNNISLASGSPDWSPDGGEIIFERGPPVSGVCWPCGLIEIWKMNANGEGLVQLTNNSYRDTDAHFSPDGTKITFNRAQWANDCCNAVDVYVMNSDGTNSVRLTTNTDYDWVTDWGENNKLLYGCNIGGNPEVCYINPDGSGYTRLTNDNYYDSPGSWSPDGGKIVFTSKRDGGIDYDVWTMNANGSNLVQLINWSSNDMGGEYSPDGNKILFVSDKNGKQDIYVMKLKDEESCVNSNLNKINVSLYVDGSYKDSKLADLSEIIFSKVNFSWILESGNHTINVKVDANDEISEANESNNKLSKEIQVNAGGICSSVNSEFYVSQNLDDMGLINWNKLGSIYNPAKVEGNYAVWNISPEGDQIPSDLKFYAMLNGNKLTVLCSGLKENSLRCMLPVYSSMRLITPPGESYYEKYGKNNTLIYSALKDVFNDLKNKSIISNSSSLIGSYTYGSNFTDKVFIAHAFFEGGEYDSYACHNWPFGDCNDRCRYAPYAYTCDYADGTVSKTYNFNYTNPGEAFLMGWIYNDNGEETLMYLNDNLWARQVNWGAASKWQAWNFSYVNKIELLGYKTWSIIAPRYWYAAVADNIHITFSAEAPDVYTYFDLKKGPAVYDCNVGTALTDLTVTDLALSNENPKAGEEVTITATVENIGGSCGNSNKPDDNSLVAYWSFDDISGNIALDEAGNNNGTIYGAKVVDGVSGKALKFDGLDDYVQIGNIGPRHTTGTIEYWMNADAVNAYRNVFTTSGISGAPSGNAGFRYEMSYPYDAFVVVIGNNRGSFMGHRITWPQNSTWYHVVVVWDSSQNRVWGYLNGILVFNDTHSLWCTNFGDIRIGVGFDDSRYFKGTIDEVQIYNQTLTANEVKANYNKIMNRSCINPNLNKINVSLYVDGNYKDSKLVYLSEINSGKVNFSWTANPGSHIISVIVDQDNEIPELNETNNKIYTTVVVRGSQNQSISIQKYSSNNLVCYDDYVDYRIVINSSIKFMQSRELIDYLPAGLKYVPGYSYIGDIRLEPAVTGNLSTGETLTWNLSNIFWYFTPLDSVEMKYRTKVREINSFAVNYVYFYYSDVLPCQSCALEVHTSTAIGKSFDCKTKPENLKKSFTLNLKEGWNLISIPLQPENSSIDSVFALIEGEYADAAAWDGKWVYKSYAYGDWFGNLSTIEAGKGYWLNMKKDANLTINGTAVPNFNILLKPGWNLIGAPVLEPVPLSKLNVNYTDLAAYKNKWIYRSYAYGNWFGELSELEPGSGYWVNVNKNANLSF